MPSVTPHRITPLPTEITPIAPDTPVLVNELSSDLKSYVDAKCLDYSGSSTVIQSKWLEDIGMVVYKPQGIFICRSCSTGVDVQHLLKHVANHKLVNRVNAEHLDYIKKYYRIRSAMDIPPPQDKIPIPFIRIDDGYICPHCDKILLKKTSMTKHLSQDHRGLSVGKTVVCREVKCQTLFPVPRRIFEVIPTSATITTAFERWLQDSKEKTFFDPKATPTAVQVEARHVSPFLKFTRWHQHLSAERQDPVKGQALVKAAETSAQQQAPYHNLQPLIIAYYKHIRTLLLNCEHNLTRFLVQYPM